MPACYRPLIEIRSFQSAHSGLICSNHCNGSSERNEVTHLLWPCKIAIKFLHVKWLNDPILVKLAHSIQPQHSSDVIQDTELGKIISTFHRRWTWWENPSVHRNSGQSETSKLVFGYFIYFFRSFVQQRCLAKYYLCESDNNFLFNILANFEECK